MAGHYSERSDSDGRAEPVESSKRATSADVASPDHGQRSPLEAVVVVDTDGGKPSPAHRPHWVLVVVAALAGALTGGLLVAWLLQPPPAPSPIAVTLDTFPEEFMGAARNDLELRRAGFGPTVDRLNKEFEEQLEAFRFAHGGRGATFGYGRLVNLTIVDGILAPGVPREGQMDFGGRVSETRRFISLDSSTVSCTFEPQPVPNASLGMEDFGDLSGVGRSECVLVDRGRNLSLRVAHSPLVRGSSAEDAASSFSEALKGLHAQLIN